MVLKVHIALCSMLLKFGRKAWRLIQPTVYSSQRGSAPAVPGVRPAGVPIVWEFLKILLCGNMAQNYQEHEPILTSSWSLREQEPA
jgi:hypothetical protein